MKITNESEFAVIIAARRKEIKMTLRALSEAAGVPKSTLSLIERGKRGASLDNAIKIANALGIEMHT